MTAPLQLELLNDSTSRLFGLRVQMPTDCRHCGNRIAVIGRGKGPHFGELKCEAHGHHCGWLSKSTADRAAQEVMMTARILRFPPRGRFSPFAVHVVREAPAWLVLCRSHGWLHGSYREAIREAREIARGFGVVVNEPYRDRL
jgi:hypothetical protein